ncbi:MAG: hypothetical protein WAP49_02155, partial [Mycobacterium sp.]
VLVDGELVWYLERGGRSLLSFSADPEAYRSAAGALAELVGAGRSGGLLVERVDGVTVLEAGRSDAAEALAGAGFARTPRGLRLR